MVITRGTRWAFGSGGVLYGVVYNAHYFVLIYYSQVLGLQPALAGLAIGIGLVFDAITDPLVGYLSDSTRSPLGRRHPWLYAAIVPLCASFYFLWHPPSFVQGHGALFAWLVACNIILRTALTMFLVSAYAIVAELTQDYDERTRLLTLFFSFYSVFANGMSVLIYAVWLVPTATQPDGVLNAAGYQQAGLFGTLLIFASVAIFTLSLQRYVPHLKQFRAAGQVSVAGFVRQVGDVLRSRSARAVMVGGVLYYAGTGTYVALWVYIYSYFWAFTSSQMTLIVIAMAVAALFLPSVMKRWCRGRDKKRVAIGSLLAAILVNMLPILMRLLDAFPDNGTTALLWVMVVAGFVETALFLVFDTTWQSMTADLAERTELYTGRRNEGVISSAIAFATKCADAIGALIGGALLAVIAFPTSATVGEVSGDVLFKLGLVYGPVVFVIWVFAIVALNRYGISRARHEQTLAQLGRA